MSQERRVGDSEKTGRHEATAAAFDTEGHSMLAYELGMSLERERRRQAEQASRHAPWSATREHRGISDRLRDGWAVAARDWRAPAAPWILCGGLAAR